MTEESTGTVAERICCILETVFGRLNTVKPDLQFNDTAYTSIAIGAHTDTTYYTLPAGLVFVFGTLMLYRVCSSPLHN